MRPNLIDIINGCCRCEEFDPGALMLTFAPACQTQYNLPSWINDIFFFFLTILSLFPSAGWNSILTVILKATKELLNALTVELML